MVTRTIKTHADVLSFMRHTLGFWPHDNLVWITRDTNRIAAMQIRATGWLPIVPRMVTVTSQPVSVGGTPFPAARAGAPG